jgi:RNA 2',3'-cyclic 3'-phosphodiesterase
MRLFVGLELGPALIQTIAADVARLRSQLDAACPSVPVRWIGAANLHITLVFLGEVGESAFPALTGALSAPLEHLPFALRLSGFGTFPPSGPPRVIWIGASDSAERVVALYDEISSRLARLGHECESRPFAPHVTVARVRDARGPQARRAREVVEAASASGGSTRISAVTLFRSHLGRGGSTYEPLLRVPLLP